MRDNTRLFNPQLASNGSVWDKSSLYKTSTQSQHEKNVLAMDNSTEQLLRTRSKNLLATSTNEESIKKPITMQDFHSYDNCNQFKTSYYQMGNMPIPPLQSYFIPKYSGFVPGMKSENPFGHSFTEATKEQMKLFDTRKYDHKAKESSYNPLSKSIGSYFKAKTQFPFRNTDPYDASLCQSGYSVNLLAKSPASIICPGLVDSNENNKTEYQASFNQKRSFHYKSPMFSTGILKHSDPKSYL